MPDPKPHEIARALLTHFDAHRRAMPWRETSDPYAIWVSEVMLQQTRVDTVIPYWTAWMERFPTVHDLADADLDDVLKRWEGLGYYSRARNLHGAAKMVRERFDGRVPDTVEELRQLPGVGEYTAGAVASIAHGVPTPAVDGNVRRVLSRLYDLEAPTAAQLRSLAAELVPTDRPGDFNQALMELGATVCTPRSPDCDACPLAEWCEARRLGVQEQRPRPKARKSVPEETVRTAVIARDDDALLLVRRPESGLLGGLWEFPGAPAGEDGSGEDGPDGGGDWPAAIRALIEASGPPVQLDPVTHTFSHKRVTYQPALYRVGETDGVGDHRATDADDAAWVPPRRLVEYALPVAQQKIARQAKARLQR